MGSSQIIEFLFHEEWRVLQDALKLTPLCEVNRATSANELPESLSNNKTCLVIASIKNKSDLIQLVLATKILRSSEVITKIVVVNFSGSKQIEKAINMLGIQDIIEERINTKALKFKIDFWVRSLAVQIKNNEANKVIKSIRSSEGGNKVDGKKSLDHTTNWIVPIDSNNDIWLIQNEVDCKRVLSRWLVKLMGPSPYVGQWSDAPGGPGLWKFEFKPEGRQVFMPTPGDWFYRGSQKPEYIWQENLWLFTGSTLELFHQNGGETKSRLKLDDKGISLAKNSDFAKAKENIIKQSFDKDLVFKRGDQSLGGSDSVDSETERLKNLEGKSKTDKLQNKELSGKGKPSHINTPQLRADLENNEKSKIQDQLTMKSGTNKLSSLLTGKSSKTTDSDKADHGVNAEKHKDGRQLDLKNKNTEYDKYLRNHNEAERFDDSTGLDKKKSVGPEVPKKDLSGKSSTDKISKYLGQSGDSRGLIAVNPPEKALTEKPGRDPENKKRNPLSQIVNKKEDTGIDQAKNDNKESQYRDTDATKNTYGGKSNTDKIPSHMGTRSATKNKEPRSSLKEDGGLEKIIPSGPLDGTPPKKEGGALNDKVSPPVHPRSSQASTDPSSKGEFYHSSSGPEKNARSTEEETGSGASPARSMENRTANKVSRKNPSDAQDLEAPEDRELALATEDAKVKSIIIKDGVRYSCELDDFFDGRIFFRTLLSGLETATNIKLDLSFDYQNSKTKLVFEASIEAVENSEDGIKFITVDLSEKNIKSFDSFMNLYRSRQNNVDVFLKKVKGL